MKKILVSLSLIICSAVSIMAQQVEKTVVVKEEEIPVAVRIAFEKDFHLINDEGSWKLTYAISSEENKTIAKPLTYTYAKKDEGKKIVIRYSPEGKLASYKGIEKAVESSSVSDNKGKS